MSPSTARRTVAATLVGALLVTFTVLAGSPHPASSGVAAPEEFTDVAVDQPRFVALDGSGELWFTASGSDRVGRVTPDGVVVTYGHVEVDEPTNITLGPDGALWFVSAANSRIGRITTGGTITTFPVVGMSDLRGIAMGPDGALWSLAATPGSVIRMTTAGVVTSFLNAGLDDPTEIVAGPDGNLWITDAGNDRLVRSSTAFVLHFFVADGIEGPRGLAVGGDGNLWFTSAQNDRIGRLTTAGVITTWPSPVDEPSRIAGGPSGEDLWVSSNPTGDLARVSFGGHVHQHLSTGAGLVGLVGDPATNHLWMAHRSTDRILRIDTEPAAGGSGRFVQHADPEGVVEAPYEMAAHTDGRLWFADIDGDRLGAIDPETGEVETFTGPNVDVPVDVTSGTDGMVFGTSSANHRIIRVAPDGSLQTIADPQGEVDRPWGIAFGPDERVWFTSVLNDRIGRLDPVSNEIVTFSHPDIDLPQDIVAGPDGNLWFGSYGSDQIGRITPTGTITMFDDPEDEVAQPLGLAVGPDDAIWFTNTVTEGGIGRLDPTTGAITVVAADGQIQGEPLNLTTGADGRLWIAESGGIVRMDTSGTVVQLAAPYDLTGDPYGIALGPDGNVWYSAPGEQLLASITPGPRFTDVGFSHPFYDEIDWMGLEGISNGSLPGPQYKPADAVSRQAMSAFLFRLVNAPAAPLPPQPTFSDVGTSHPFYEEVEWMAFAEVSEGYPDGTYRPSDAVTRQAMSAFLHRVGSAGPVSSPPTTPTFADVGTTHPFFDDIQWMGHVGISTGYPGSPKPTYRPADPVTRQAMAAFLFRFSAAGLIPA